MFNSDSDQTQSLLQQILKGGREAFDELFAQHRPFVRQVVELRLDSRLRARVDPSDVVQETQMEAFRRLPDYLERQPMPFRLWLHKMACERVIMTRRQHLNAARRSISNEKPLPDRSSMALANQLMASGASPSQNLTKKELAIRVQDALRQLDEADRDILIMRNFEALSYNEIAALLEINPAAARKRNGRALLRLHELLSADGLTASQL